MSTYEHDPDNTLMTFQNPDKQVTRRSGTGEYMPQWPFRLLVCGPPNSGKRNMLLNVIYKLKPPPSAFHIIHYDSETTEYNDLQQFGVPIYYYDPKDFPTIDNLANPDPPEEVDTLDVEESFAEVLDNINFGSDPLVIIDEVTKDILGKEGTSRFERLMNFGSSHKNTTVLCSIQSIVNLPPNCRRGFNNYVLWKQSDKMANTLAATRAGIPPAELDELFGLCQGKHDSIWIDCDRANDDDYRFRLNMLTPIKVIS